MQNTIIGEWELQLSLDTTASILLGEKIKVQWKKEEGEWKQEKIASDTG